ncbi:hypothetical protein [Phreatobacter sp.]|uniref:hypothetical protein n=1 Tax=Phreatobacter sp. TaxID=1966341 RepID=UPI0022C7A003|nr:hypothetical protein [Phreatobacter sp.]MCZ8317091.1 hypothetical protein [Phreatobacter sp.]
MRQTITKLFGTQAQATAAAEALKAGGYTQVFLVLGAEPGASDAAADPETTRAIMAAHIYKSDAEIYATHLARGASLVSVHAIFGSAVRAINTLKSFDPLPDAIPKPPVPSRFVYSIHTPFSSTFELPLLTEKVRYPAETFSGIASLTRTPRVFTSKLMPMLSEAAAPFSRMLSLPTLTRSGTPFSSLFRLPMLTRRAERAG